MLDASLFHSPFKGHEAGDHPNAAGKIGVRLSAARCASVLLLGSWVGNGPTLEDAVSQAVGAAAPERPGTTCATPLGLLMRIAPEEFLLVGDAAANRVATLRHRVTADLGSVTDLSHARCRIHIEGENCLDTLSKLFALDLRENTFPLNEIRLSGHHHVPCVLHRRGLAEFDLYVFSSYAHDQLETLKDAALEFGVRLDFQDSQVRHFRHASP